MQYSVYLAAIFIAAIVLCMIMIARRRSCGKEIVILNEIITDERSFHIRHFPSRNPFRKPVKETENSFKRVLHFVKNDPKAFVLFSPRYVEKCSEENKHCKRIVQNIMKVFLPNLKSSEGFVFFTQDIAASLSLLKCQRKPKNILFDVVILTETHPAVILSVIDETQDRMTVMLYNNALSAEVAQTICYFAEEDFALCHSVLSMTDIETEDGIKSQIENLKCESNIKYRDRQIEMYKEKFHNILEGFIAAAATTDIPLLKTVDLQVRHKNQLFVLTQDQFRAVITCLDTKDMVKVSGKPKTGKTVLALDVAQRLQINNSVLFITEEEGLQKRAKSFNICTEGVSKKAFLKDKDICKGIQHVIYDGKNEVVVFKDVNKRPNAHSVISKNITAGFIRKYTDILLNLFKKVSSKHEVYAGISPAESTSALTDQDNMENKESGTTRLYRTESEESLDSAYASGSSDGEGGSIKQESLEKPESTNGHKAKLPPSVAAGPLITRRKPTRHPKSMEAKYETGMLRQRNINKVRVSQRHLQSKKDQNEK